MDGDGDRGWWPPAHPWDERRDEVGRLARSATNHRLVLLVAALVLAGPVYAAGAAGRGEILGTGTGLVIGLAVTTAVVKYLDHRLARRRRAGAVVHAPTLGAVRLRHGLAPVAQGCLPDWLTGLRAFHTRADGLRVQPVEWLARGHELVVVAGSVGGGAVVSDLVVLRRLPVALASFRLWPRRRFDRRAGHTIDDLYNLRPNDAVVPDSLAAWLVAERPRCELAVAAHWCSVRRADDRLRPLSAPAVEALIDELVGVADRVTEVVGP